MIANIARTVIIALQSIPLSLKHAKIPHIRMIAVVNIMEFLFCNDEFIAPFIIFLF